MRGGREVADIAGVVIIGGHTVEDDEPKYGMSVTGTVEMKKIKKISDARAGDKMVLTKPIGIGVLATALKAGLLSEMDIVDAIDNAATLNKAAADIMHKYDVSACTDVTGFGLIGHLSGVMKASEKSCKVYADHVPMYDLAIEQAKMGIIPEGTYKNREFVGEDCDFTEGIQQEVQDLLFDPQTSGGLLIFVAKDDADSLVEELRLNQDVPVAEIIGEVTELEEEQICVINLS